MNMNSSFSHDKLSTRRITTNPVRPPFSQTKTSDRLRECERRTSITSIPLKPRRSVFREEGLEDMEHSVHRCEGTKERTLNIREEDTTESNVTFDGILKALEHKEQMEHPEGSTHASLPWYSKIGRGSRPKITTAASAPPSLFSSIPRVALIVFLIALVVPGFRYGGDSNVNIPGADAGVIMRAELVENGSLIEGRQLSSTEICTRWAHMTALVNGTLYVYGGQSKTTSGQVSNTWSASSTL